MIMGKKLTTKNLKDIVKAAREIRKNAGSRKVTTTKEKFNMKWTEAIKRGAKKVLHKP